MADGQTFGSLFTGIGGFDLGLQRAGWDCLWQVEINPYRRGVLDRWFPEVPRYEDVRLFGRGEYPRGGRPLRADGSAQARRRKTGSGSRRGPDLICGGFPCQDLSVAGRRAGLAGERSGLFFEFARIAGSLRPTWLLIENVPGLLSSHGGRDFAILLATLADLGYGVAWRVLDSRYFGVPQRRRRVFIVGYLGADGPEAFLPFLEGCEGSPASGGAPRSYAARSSPESAPEPGGYVESVGRRSYSDRGDAGANILSRALTRGNRISGDEETFVHSLTSEGADASEDGTGRGTPLVAAPLTRGSHPRSNAAGRRQEDDFNLVAPTLSTKNETASSESAREAWYEQSSEQIGEVRRLTTVECCRLQGFPDDWLGGDDPPDTPKYAALGDAVTVPVIEWIGRRLIRPSA